MHGSRLGDASNLLSGLPMVSPHAAHALFERLQHFRLLPYRSTQITGTKQYELYIPRYTFARLDGNLVREAAVSLYLIELSDLDELVLTDRPTATRETPLESGGLCFLQAYAHGEPLHLVKPIQLNIPLQHSLQQPQALSQFSGRAVPGNFRPTVAAKLDWFLANQNSARVSGDRMRLQLDRLGWINCSAPRPELRVQRQPKQLRLEKAGNNPLSVYFAFSKMNGLLELHPTPNRKQFSSHGLPSERSSLPFMPAGYYDYRLPVRKETEGVIIIQERPLSGTGQQWIKPVWEGLEGNKIAIQTGG